MQSQNELSTLIDYFRHSIKIVIIDAAFKTGVRRF